MRNFNTDNATHLSYKKPIAIAVITLMIAGMIIPAVMAMDSAAIWTDKTGYVATDVVYVSGSGFELDSTVVLTLTGPTDFVPYSWIATADGEGNFQTSYGLGLMPGTFVLSATDGTNTATTTFVDSRPLQFVETGLPSSTSWSVTVTGMSPDTKSSTTNTIAFGNAAEPSSWPFSVASPITVSGVQYVPSPLSGTASVPSSGSGPFITSITFTASAYQVAFAVSPASSGTTNPSTTAFYADGAVIDPLTATAAVGYTFSSWSVTTTTGTITIGNTALASTTATIHGTGTITADFVSAPTNISPTAAFTWSPTTPDEGESVQFTDQSTHSTPGYVDAWAWSFSDGGTSALQNPTHTFADNGVYTVSLTVTDNDGASSTPVTHEVTVNNVAPTVGAIEIIPSTAVVKVGDPVSASASFTDPGTLDTHTATWDWGDTLTDDVNPAASPVSGSHTYTAAGVYTVKLTVTDKDNGVGTSTFEYVVVYDPNGGFVTGGGWINSPKGAYIGTDLEGKATFGFVSKYLKGATVPTGNTEFQFHAADMNFKSTSYEWLVVAGTKAMYKGVGTINGAGNYGFILSAIDGGAKGTDKFRIQIWDKNNADTIVYDNMLASAPDLITDPATIISGSIVVHK